MMEALFDPFEPEITDLNGIHGGISRGRDGNSRIWTEINTN